MKAHCPACGECVPAQPAPRGKVRVEEHQRASVRITPSGERAPVETHCVGSGRHV